MNIKAIILDMDGVLWHGETALPGLDDLFDTLEARGLPFMLATNNAMKMAEDYTEKLKGFGVEVPSERILTSSEATASYLRRQYPDEDRVYVVGEQGLHRAVEAQGFQVVTPEEVREGGSALIVVTGLARDALTYDLLAMATLLLNGGAKLVASNADASYPTELGFFPGAGALLSVLMTASGAEPTVVGKPNPLMFEEALRQLETDAADTLMVGDRLSTDIKGAKAAGMQTLLLLSGVSSREDLEESDVQPDAVMDDIRELTRALAADEL